MKMMKIFQNSTRNSDYTYTYSSGWAPGKRLKFFKGSFTWTRVTNTEQPKGKQGVVIDNGRWLDFGQPRFIFRKFNEKPSSAFNDGYSFIKALENKGFVKLGSGAFSTVLAKPGQSRVIKVTRRPDGWIDYIHWGSKKGSPFVPKVFSYKKIKGKKNDFEVAIVERLEYTFSNAPEDHALRIIPYLMDRSSKNPMAARFMEILSPGLKDFMEEVQKEFNDSSLDLHAGNLMIRKDGSFVLSDPIADKARTEYKRLKAGDFSPAIPLERNCLLIAMRN